MRGTNKMVTEMEKGSSIMMMEGFMKENGKMIACMVLESSTTTIKDS